MNKDTALTGAVRVVCVLGMVLLLAGHSGVAEQLKPFPEHWGDPPSLQTRDDVVWPGGYGNGSGTVARWIQQNMEKDASAGTGSTPTLYSMDFRDVEVGQLPEDFMVLNGEFTVQEENGEKFMQLPGAPVESFAVMFGPAGSEDLEVSARVQGTSQGRRHPTFALGLNGLGGYRLKIVPARRRIELWRGSQEGGTLVDEASFPWKSKVWVTLKLRLRRDGESHWRVEGKAWSGADTEPADWQVLHVENEKPLPGRPFVAASPYSGIPIRFDDLILSRVAE